MKPSKFSNVTTVVDGIRFPSKKQARRYGELKLLQKAGVVVDLRLEVPYELAVNGTKIATYVADFVYGEVKKTAPREYVMEEVVEDTKGVRTPVYKLKKKLMRALHGIDIKET